jgi:hypothetical protein
VTPVILSAAKDLGGDGRRILRSFATLRMTGVCALLLTFASLAHAAPLPDYIAALERIHSSIEANQLDAAKAEANRVRAMEVEWAHGRFRADAVLLNDVAKVKTADPQLLARLRITIDELRRSGGADGGKANANVLQQVANEQKAGELPKGGDVRIAPGGDSPLLVRIGESIASMFRWLGKQVRDFLEWVADLWPDDEVEAAGKAASGTRWVATAITIVIALAIVILALEVVRRAKRGEAQQLVTSEPIGSKRDEDPLSRGATEWERYAAQLAAAGRFREAIRAWYHAVLVTCWSAGALHFRKGRTNWEYIASVAPSVVWRPELIQLTRSFEREWYGHDQSTPDALDDCSAHARRILGALRGGA